MKKEISELRTQVSTVEKGKEKQEDYISEQQTLLKNNTNVEIYEVKTHDFLGLSNMKIMAVQHQPYHGMLKFKIQGEVFILNTLLNMGANLNVLNKNSIPAKY